MKIKKRTIVDHLIELLGVFSLKNRRLRTGSEIIFTSLVFMTDAYPSGRGIHEDYSFDARYHGLQQQRLLQPDRRNSHQIVEQMDRLAATKVIRGVVDMYRENVKFKPILIRFSIGKLVESVNASYSHTTRTFEFPHVKRGNKILRTALDQGIVSHEAGHMILHHLIQLYGNSHTGAFHEAFGDVTSYFYRFYNPETRQDFIDMLTNNQGCVGDNAFTCVRDNSRMLKLGQTGCEVHALSRPFSSAIFDNMVTSYANSGWLTWAETAADNVISWHKRTLIRAVLSIKTSNPTLMDIAQGMLQVSHLDPEYREGLGRNFIRNNLVVLMYQTLPTPRSPNPPVVYQPNKKFSTLCLREE